MTDFSEDIENALEALRNGETILYPTDTVWGIGCDATNPEAAEKVFSLKKRPPQKSCILLLADPRDLLQYVTALDLAVFDYIDQLTRPTTIIYPDVTGVAENLINEDGTVAFRIVTEPFCKHLIKRFRKPIVSTSANISGAPAPANFCEISPEIRNGAGYVVKYRQDDNSIKQPSAIVRWMPNGDHIVIRS